MDTLTVTLTNRRVIDGYVEAANRNGFTPEDLVAEFANAQGRRYADNFKIGVITSAAFIARFTPAEYNNILVAAELPASPSSPEQAEAAQTVGHLVNELLTTPHVALDDPRLERGLMLLVREGLLEEERVGELLSYHRPSVPSQTEQT
jgi:hypothetical protein